MTNRVIQLVRVDAINLPTRKQTEKNLLHPKDMSGEVDLENTTCLSFDEEEGDGEDAVVAEGDDAAAKEGAVAPYKPAALPSNFLIVHRAR